MTADPVEVVVVGAGPTGLALALQAPDHDTTVRVLQRRIEAFRASRALIVHPRTLEVLRPLGATDALLERSDVTPSAHLHLGSEVGRAQLDSFELPDSAFPYLVLIRQAEVEAVLAEALTRRSIDIERASRSSRSHHSPAMRSRRCATTATSQPTSSSVATVQRASSDRVHREVDDAGFS